MMDNNELRITVIGPGYGESIIIHAGFDDWIIIDSCINPNTKKPTPLEYLESIGVNPDKVKVIVATHWHDDHIRGLSDLVDICVNAKIVISEAMAASNFKELISLYSVPIMVESGSGLSEFSKTYKILIDGGKKPVRAIADRPIYRNIKPDESYECTVTSLSPSDASIHLSNLQLADIIPKINDEKRRIPPFYPNHSSVVLWITINDKSLLLGADLEHSKDTELGWNAILQSTTKPNGKSKVFKIPHHGSENAHSDEVWEKMLVENPIVVLTLTPFRRGKVSLPKHKDIVRIKDKTKNCFITASSQEKKAKVHKKIIDKEMAKTVRKRSIVHSSFGSVSISSKTDIGYSEWSIMLNGNAFPLEDSKKSGKAAPDKIRKIEL